MSIIKTQNGIIWIMLISALAFLLLASGSLSEARADQLNMKEIEEQAIPRARIASIPSSLTRFLFYSARPERQSGTNFPGYKRSSSALDALTGVTLGKRSPPAEYLNLDPYFARQLPRFYTDFRWSPMDLYELSASQNGADQMS